MKSEAERERWKGADLAEDQRAGMAKILQGRVEKARYL
jgi:hypothetical protein